MGARVAVLNIKKILRVFIWRGSPAYKISVTNRGKTIWDNLRFRRTIQRASRQRKQKQLGNSVIVVEHDRDMMLAADQIVDLGPGAGSHGGKVLFSGDVKDISKICHSETASFLNYPNVKKKNKKIKKKS